MTTAKLFKNGRSQAVRLPKEFRFEGDVVNIRREGNTVVLEAIPEPAKDPWAWLDEMPGELDADFLAAMEEEPEPYDDSKLDNLFK